MAKAVSHAFDRAPAYRRPWRASSHRHDSSPSRLGARSGCAGSAAQRARQFSNPFTGESAWYTLARCSPTMRWRQYASARPRSVRGQTRSHSPSAVENARTARPGGTKMSLAATSWRWALEVDRRIRPGVQLLAQRDRQRSEVRADAPAEEIRHREIDVPRMAVVARGMERERPGEQVQLGRDRPHGTPVVQVEEREPELAPARNGQHAAGLARQPPPRVPEQRLVATHAQQSAAPRTRAS